MLNNKLFSLTILKLIKIKQHKAVPHNIVGSTICSLTVLYLEWDYNENQKQKQKTKINETYSKSEIVCLPIYI